MRKIQWSAPLLAAVIFTYSARAQSVGINEDGSTPNPNAILDVRSATRGILIPRISTAARLAIPGNTAGLLVYDSTTASFWYNNGFRWVNMTQVTSGGGADSPGNANAWSLGGNTLATGPAILGTTNQIPLDIRVNNQPSGHIDGINNRLSTYWGYRTAPNAIPDSASNNTGIGAYSLFGNTVGYANTAVGYLSLYTNNGDQNTGVGNYALYANGTGEHNAAFGHSAFANARNGFANTALGAYADGNDNLHNSTAIGSSAWVNASNKVRIGSNAVTVIEGAVPFTTPSDGRFKFQVREDVKGLDFILALRPVTYQLDTRRLEQHARGAASVPAADADLVAASAVRRSGFIAQEVEKAADATGYSFSGVVRPQNEQDHYSLSYEAFVVPLVKAVQEQQRTIRQQEKRLTDLQRQIDELKKRVIQSPL